VTDESPDLGTWQPASPIEATQLFSSVDAPWWVAGGLALDLFLGCGTRQHHDLDVGVLRRDIAKVLQALSSWDVFEAKDGALTPLRTGQIPHPGVNALWCRPSPIAAWALELMLDDSQDDMWLFRRAREICRPMSEVVRFSPLGTPYLAPEIQLLYKAKRPRERDVADFNRTLPHLDADSRKWLSRALAVAHPQHEWIDALKPAS
jgi:aminoglycoside-2''-adenylyltransferase